jgi:hypothetical protein
MGIVCVKTWAEQEPELGIFGALVAMQPAS